MMHMAERKTNMRKRQRGVAAVETVIVLPILLLAFLATAEIGRAMQQYNTLTKSVRDGGRHLATHALDDFTTSIVITPALETEAKNLARYGNIVGIGSTLLPNYADAHLTLDVPDAEHVSLVANYPYQPMLFNTLPLFGFGNDIPVQFTMQTSVTMRAL